MDLADPRQTDQRTAVSDDYIHGWLLFLRRSALHPNSRVVFEASLARRQTRSCSSAPWRRLAQGRTPQAETFSLLTETASHFPRPHAAFRPLSAAHPGTAPPVQPYEKV